MLIALWILGLVCLRAQPLPIGWSQNISAEVVFNQARAISENVPYLEASKSKLINNPASGFIIYQRRMPDGKIETQNVRTHLGRISAHRQLRHAFLASAAKAENSTGNDIV